MWNILSGFCAAFLFLIWSFGVGCGFGELILGKKLVVFGISMGKKWLLFGVMTRIYQNLLG